MMAPAPNLRHSLITFALDTATPVPALALVGDDGAIAGMWLGQVPGGGRRVLEAAHHLFGASGVAPSDLGQIVVGIGPGGFTGLRIGIATAMGLGQALGIPVHGASTLEALALGAAGLARPGEVTAAVIDAKRREVFAAAYAIDGDALREVLAPAAWDPATLAEALAHIGPVVMVGDGTALVPPASSLRVAGGDAPHRVDASLLVMRVRVSGPLPVQPSYLRLPDAEENRLRRIADEATT